MDKVLDYSGNILLAVVVLIAGVMLIKGILKLITKALDKSTLDASVHKFLITAARYGLYILLAVVILTSLKVPTTPLVTMMGACGAAVALALKDSLGNIAGGIIILANKPFLRGEFIEIGGVSGSVQSIDLLVTTLKTADNKVITIPNGTITTSVLINYSREEMRRVDCQFGISYDSDIVKAKDVLMAIAESNPYVFADPEPIIGVAAHQDSCILLDMKVWCSTTRYWEIKYYLEEQVKLAFDEAGITIPYPQMDVRVIK
ncbi:MAG: mechanosensitive ion channel [Firmicutes bacterium]|nr:mechanosensitive ion channel [Bacillota bacterium]